jgi:Histone methylation protein DOT1
MVVDMSTIIADVPLIDESRCCTELHVFLAGLEGDSLLLQRGRLRERLIALDRLDAALGGLDLEGFASSDHACMHRRAMALRMRLEAGNAELYQSIRSKIVSNQARALLLWLEDAAGDDEPKSPSPELGFDYRDELVSGVLQLPEPREPNVQPSPEMVPYQPTPVRHILRLIAAAAVGADDVLVDLGSGLGHVPLLVSMATGARSLGVEIQGAYVASARKCARSLHLSRVQFTVQDARDADLSSGTVFYLYSPFKGSILTDVLCALRKESMRRVFKICTLGPCTERVSNETWLRTSALSGTGSITVFDSV